MKLMACLHRNLSLNYFLVVSLYTTPLRKKHALGHLLNRTIPTCICSRFAVSDVPAFAIVRILTGDMWFLHTFYYARSMSFSEWETQKRRLVSANAYVELLPRLQLIYLLLRPTTLSPKVMWGFREGYKISTHLLQCRKYGTSKAHRVFSSYR